MTLNELKAAILENGTGIYFEFNGKKCGVEPEVQIFLTSSNRVSIEFKMES